MRAIRNGWLKTKDQLEKPEEQPSYLLWADDNLADATKTATGLSYIPAPKPKLPGHAESYNPPKEYLPTEVRATGGGGSGQADGVRRAGSQAHHIAVVILCVFPLGFPELPSPPVPQEEQASWELLDPEDRPKFVPQAFDSLRHVPMYTAFIKEIFERCLDLYLCPRIRKKRMHIDPESLVPQLPKPRDLMPFPTTLAIRFTGHAGKVGHPAAVGQERMKGTCCLPTLPAGKSTHCLPARKCPSFRYCPILKAASTYAPQVRSIAPDASGQWLLSGSDDGTMRLWEVRSGRCVRTWDLGAPVHCVTWCPSPTTRIAAACVGSKLVMLHSGLGGAEAAAASAEALKVGAVDK